jgi:hypothetical protein
MEQREVVELEVVELEVVDFYFRRHQKYYPAQNLLELVLE